MGDIVKINTFLTDLSRYAEYGRARTEAFPSGVPASTVVGTTALVRPELMVEVEAIAVIGSGD
jgi:enamine deaminase RidA (YjgF/YER057c/UK114 family)